MPLVTSTLTKVYCRSDVSSYKAEASPLIIVLQDNDPLTDKAYADLMLPPWPFWRACTAVGLPILLLMLPVNEVSPQSLSSVSFDTAGIPCFQCVVPDTEHNKCDPGYTK